MRCILPGFNSTRWYPRTLDPRGGFFPAIDSNGSIVEPDLRHIVATTRSIMNCAWGYLEHKAQGFPRPETSARLLACVEHGVSFLRSHHLNPATGGYAWIIDLASPPAASDRSNRSYAFAFVTSAYSLALACGVESCRAHLAEVTATWTSRMWEPTHSLYADVAAEDWSTTDDYRGNNCNMHGCEAHLLAYNATGDAAHLDRASAIAAALCQRQAGLCAGISGPEGGLVYEHYTRDWSAPDVEFHRGDASKDRFRPWGFQPGHLLQWSKLLLLLDAKRPAPWLLPTALRFFEASWKHAWDDTPGRGGGLVYGFAPQLPGAAAPGFPWCDEDKYAWVQNEGAAAAALLAARVPPGSALRTSLLARYDALWGHCQAAYVCADAPPAPAAGLWLRVLGPDCSPQQQPEGAPLVYASESHYHVIGTLLDAAGAFERIAAEESGGGVPVAGGAK